MSNTPLPNISGESAAYFQNQDYTQNSVTNVKTSKLEAVSGKRLPTGRLGERQRGS